MQLLIATKNAHKLEEFRQMLQTEQLQIVGVEDLGDAPDVEETGQTFRANACLKASAYAKHFGCFAIADDSGLSVDALAGKPGVHSARWAELHDRGSGDADNNALLLDQLDQICDDNRSARFVCVLALSDPDGQILLTSQGHVEGQVLRDFRGENGFGYDPLFMVPGLGLTTAQLPPAQKHEISHRGIALQRLKVLLEKYRLFS